MKMLEKAEVAGLGGNLKARAWGSGRTEKESGQARPVHGRFKDKETLH